MSLLVGNSNLMCDMYFLFVSRYRVFVGQSKILYHWVVTQAFHHFKRHTQRKKRAGRKVQTFAILSHASYALKHCDKASSTILYSFVKLLRNINISRAHYIDIKNNCVLCILINQNLSIETMLIGPLSS